MGKNSRLFLKVDLLGNTLGGSKFLISLWRGSDCRSHGRSVLVRASCSLCTWGSTGMLLPGRGRNCECTWLVGKGWHIQCPLILTLLCYLDNCYERGTVCNIECVETSHGACSWLCGSVLPFRSMGLVSFTILWGCPSLSQHTNHLPLQQVGAWLPSCCKFSRGSTYPRESLKSQAFRGKLKLCGISICFP